VQFWIHAAFASCVALYRAASIVAVKRGYQAAVAPSASGLSSPVASTLPCVSFLRLALPRTPQGMHF